MFDDSLRLYFSGLMVSNIFKRSVSSNSMYTMFGNLVDSPNELRFTSKVCDNNSLFFENEDGWTLLVEHTGRTSEDLQEVMRRSQLLDKLKTLEAGVGDDSGFGIIERISNNENGCSCSFSKTEEDFNKQRYIYQEINSGSVAVVNINGISLRINLSFDVRSKYKVDIDEESRTDAGVGVMKRTGAITVTLPNGSTISTSFVGECKC